MKNKNLLVKSLKLIEKDLNERIKPMKILQKIDRYLMFATAKSLKLAKSLIILCDKGHSSESMPILRSLIEHVVNMRWIMNKNTNERLNSFLKDLEKFEFGKRWTNCNLCDRMTELGFKNKNYYDFVVKLTYSYAHANASSLDINDLINPKPYNDNKHSEAIYVVTAQMMGHVMMALNKRYPKYFKNYTLIWNQIKGCKNIRKKHEKLKQKHKFKDNINNLHI
ncbi:MAG: hypothetical protein GF335_00230 [Candidatus Moranbacteria bacterium]|nr:hypothetical protein [Candidatus Moranbacteria bacterium]